VGPLPFPPFRGDLLASMLLPEVGFNLGNPSPKSPPIPGSLGVASEVAELFRPLLPLLEACEEAVDPPVRLLLVFTALLLLFADFPPTRGEERSFVTAFFKALPCCIDLSKSPRSAVPPPLDLVGDLKAGGLGGPPAGGGGGPGGGGGGGIFFF